MTHKPLAARGALLVVFLGLSVSSAAVAETVAFKATLTAAAEVPPVTAAGSGQGGFNYDTESKVLSYTITYRGLTGSATASHIHGPASPGASAAVVRAFPVPESPILGKAVLTDEQTSELLAGQLYVDVHTDANKNGEIRGQIIKTQ